MIARTIEERLDECFIYIFDDKFLGSRVDVTRLEGSM